VMVSESTARLVASAVVLGERELVRVKGSDTPVPAQLLLAIGDHHLTRRAESKLVGRTRELDFVTAILEEAVDGNGCVVGVLGPPGIGKSRLIREIAAVARARRLPVFTTYCESHATGIPFHVLARLLRASVGIDHLDADTARALVRELFTEADPSDLLLLDDLLGIRDAGAPLPDIAPDARRRRLTTLVNSQSLARAEPAVYVIEDVHWIDEVSESMLADFLAVVPQLPSLTLITYRPEYRGALSRMSGAQTLALRPLNDVQASTLSTQLLGDDPSLDELAAQIAFRAAGNPFFAEEIVRDLTERGVLQGKPGAYHATDEVTAVDVPATLQAAIGARVDRLEPVAKNTLNAGAVIGARFDTDLLTALIDDADVDALVEAELVDQVRYFPRAEYAFRHPLIRAVAYESQLKSDRARLHRRVAEAIETHGSVDENAALIAEHYEAAGDLHAAFEWHMRAGGWSNIRDNAAAQTSWRRARQVADMLPEADADRLAMRIAPRTVLCATATITGGSGAETGFEELRDLCNAAGDKRSLAIAMAGHTLELYFNARLSEASHTATELVDLLESIGDPTLTLALLSTAVSAKQETYEMTEVLRLAERGIELAGGDPTKGKLQTGSPLTLLIAMRGEARCFLGMAGWRQDFERATSMGRAAEPITHASALFFTYIVAIMNGVLSPTASVLRQTEQALTVAEQSGEDVVLAQGRQYLGVILVRAGGDSRAKGFELLEQVREMTLEQRFNLEVVRLLDVLFAEEKIRVGDLAGAISSSRAAVNDFFANGDMLWSGYATNVLLEALLQSGSADDLTEAEAAVDRLATAPIEPGVVVHKAWLLRAQAMLARARGDEGTYFGLRDNYRKMATELGFEGHMAMAEAMP
jgi:adenylate cyclase